MEDKIAEICEILEKEILQDSCDVRNDFVRHFKEEIDKFINFTSIAYYKCELLDKKIHDDMQKAYAIAFLFNSLNTILISFKLIISGNFIGSQPLMRSVIESLAMSILCTDKSYYNKIKDNKFSANKAISTLLSKSTIFDINKSSVKSLKKSYEFYHKFCHSGLEMLAASHSFSEKGMHYIGAHYDRGKYEYYKKELEGRINLLRVLIDVITYFESKLENIK